MVHAEILLKCCKEENMKEIRNVALTSNLRYIYVSHKFGSFRDPGG